MEGRRLFGAATAAVGLLLGGCTSTDVEAGSPSHTTGCPVTTPTTHPAVALPENRVVSNPGVPDVALGNEFLWVAPSPDGVLQVSQDVERPGYYWQKVPWWRVTAGQLEIEARQLDGSGTFDYYVGTVSEYGPTGFVSSSLSFSAPGCWSITGRVGAGSLTFVARVVEFSA